MEKSKRRSYEVESEKPLIDGQNSNCQNECAPTHIILISNYTYNPEKTLLSALEERDYRFHLGWKKTKN